MYSQLISHFQFNGFDYPNLVQANSTFNDTESNYATAFAPQVVGIYTYMKLTQTSEGVFEFIVNFDPDYSTACIVNIWCSSESKNESPLSVTLYETDTSFFDKHLADLSEDTFFESNVTWTYETSLEYRCPKAMSFVDDSLSQTFKCEWDGNWTSSQATLKTCKWTHCIDPPRANPVNVTQLEPVWNGGLVNFDSNITYKCMRGMKFKNSFTLQSQEATCRSNNTWDAPATWNECVETKYCDIPPELSDGGSVEILSDGYMYGHNCSTGGKDKYIELKGQGDCHTQSTAAQFNQYEHIDDGTHINSSYKILLYNGDVTNNQAVVSFLTFSQPVNLNIIKIDGSPKPTLSPTETDTTLRIEASLSRTGAQNIYDLTVTVASGEQEPCLVYSSCNFCSALGDDSCAAVDFARSATFPTRNVTTRFGAELEYSCSLGQEFHNSGSGQTDESITIECKWDGKWNPDMNTLPKCVWVACLEPPIPDDSTHLVRNYTGGTLIGFGEVATYTCKDGYYFGDDYYKTAFTLECLNDGSFAAPEWDQCYAPSERYCFDPPTPPYNGGKSDWNEASYKDSKTPYDTVVTYSCGLGRQLLEYTANDTKLHNSTQYKCEWDRTWSPDTDPYDCEWVACIDPPLPEGHNLKSDFDGVNPYEFYSYATYTCESGFFFEQNRSMTSFEVQCWSGGRWRAPNPWPKCVTTVECEEPRPKPNAGTRKWFGELEYEAKAEYTCGPYARFFNGATNETYEKATLQCSWNKTWSPKSLDNCTWLSCPIVPEPPKSSNLLFSPANGSSLTLLSDYSTYGTDEDQFSVHPGFMKDRRFLVDGYIADTVDVTRNVTRMPTFELRDDLGRIALKLVIDVEDQEVTLTSEWNPSKYSVELIDVFVGEHFELEVVFDTTNFEFQIKYNGGEMAPYNVPTEDYWFGNVSFWGDIHVQYAGFPYQSMVIHIKQS